MDDYSNSSDMLSSAIPGVATLHRVYKDGTVSFRVDIDPTYAKQLQNFPVTPDIPVVLAMLSQEGSQQIMRQDMIESDRPFAKQAQALKTSGFFLAPKVWTHVGTDAEFLSWLRAQPCALHGKKAIGQCRGDVVSAHVRRVANGAGTGIKPLYSAIPLCDTHHRQQHSGGESAIGGQEFIDRLRCEYVSNWCWERLKTILGYQHWYDVPPALLRDWAAQKELTVYLPREYR